MKVPYAEDLANHSSRLFLVEKVRQSVLDVREKLPLGKAKELAGLSNKWDPGFSKIDILGMLYLPDKKIRNTVDNTTNRDYIIPEVNMNVILKRMMHIDSELLEIEVPPDLMGKDVEVTIKEKKMKKHDHELENFFSRFNYDLSKFVFNRDELYER